MEGFFFLLALFQRCRGDNTAKKNTLVTYHNIKLLVTVTCYMLLQTKLISAVCWIMEHAMLLIRRQ